MSQKYSNNFIDNILKKLKEADDLIIKKYELFISGKNSFFNSKIQILNDINKYFNDIKENFENEHKKNLNFINSYFNEIEKEFFNIDELLQNNKRIINKGINYINILMNQNFIEVKLSDQLQLIQELNLDSLLDNNINNKINLFLYQIKKNLLIPKINVENKVIELIKKINDSFSIKVNEKFYNILNSKNININNIFDEKSINDNNSLTNFFLDKNDFYLEEENNELKNLIEDLCFYINKMELSPNYIWFEPNSSNIYDISLNNNKINAIKINYNYIGKNNSFLFNEDFRVSNLSKNLLYISGGKINNRNIIINDIYEYNLIQKSLIQKSSMNQKRINHGSIIIGNYLYICGGNDENFNTLDSCEIYNIIDNKCIFISPMKEKLSKINLIQIDNKTFAVFGGLKDNKNFNHNIHYYRIDTNTWFILDNLILPYGLIYPGLCNISSKFILIFGGINEKNQESKEIFKMDITSGNIEKMNNYLDYGGFCIYTSIYSNKEVHLLLNHKGQKFPDRVVYHLPYGFFN